MLLWDVKTNCNSFCFSILKGQELDILKLARYSVIDYYQTMQYDTDVLLYIRSLLFHMFYVATTVDHWWLNVWRCSDVFKNQWFKYQIIVILSCFIDDYNDIRECMRQYISKGTTTSTPCRGRGQRVLKRNGRYESSSESESSPVVSVS